MALCSTCRRQGCWVIVLLRCSRPIEVLLAHWVVRGSSLHSVDHLWWSRAVNRCLFSGGGEPSRLIGCYALVQLGGAALRVRFRWSLLLSSLLILLLHLVAKSDCIRSISVTSHSVIVLIKVELLLVIRMVSRTTYSRCRIVTTFICNGNCCIVVVVIDVDNDRLLLLRCEFGQWCRALVRSLRVMLGKWSHYSTTWDSRVICRGMLVRYLLDNHHYLTIVRDWLLFLWLLTENTSWVWTCATSKLSSLLCMLAFLGSVCQVSQAILYRIIRWLGRECLHCTYPIPVLALRWKLYISFWSFSVAAPMLDAPWFEWWEFLALFLR